VTEGPQALLGRAAALDEADPLSSYREAFLPAEGVIAYLDGNSLGRPLRASSERFSEFVQNGWGERLIRGWDEGWMDAPVELGDQLGRTVLGADAGQTVVADSTTVLLYKLVRAAVDARPQRDVIVADTRNFPTDRYIVQGVAAERGLTICWIEPEPRLGVTAEQVREAVDERTALVLFSHIDFRSGYIADMAAITDAVHEAGAVVLWDLCHSVGAVELGLDAAGVDLAVGCTYKYLNGGPGSPAFAYVATGLQDSVVQPIQGWMGSAEPFQMGPGYEPATGMRRFISGTPPIVGMLPLRDSLQLIRTVGMPAIRSKSVKLTDFAIQIADEHLAPFGVEVASPRDPNVRGGHVTLEHPDFARIVPELWARGVIPDFRPPSGMRIGLSPLSTSFTELAVGLVHVAALLGGD